MKERKNEGKKDKKGRVYLLAGNRLRRGQNTGRLFIFDYTTLNFCLMQLFIPHQLKPLSRWDVALSVDGLRDNRGPFTDISKETLNFIQENMGVREYSTPYIIVNASQVMFRSPPRIQKLQDG